MIDRKLVVIINFNGLKPFEMRIKLYRSINKTILSYIYIYILRILPVLPQCLRVSNYILSSF